MQETLEALIDDGISLADETAVERFDKPGRFSFDLLIAYTRLSSRMLNN